MSVSDTPTPSHTQTERVLSGMRPTGALHLGHYHGALKNWVRLQDELNCFYFVADWHALTTHYENREVIEKNVYEMVIDWLAAGLDPAKCTMFLQSRIPEHAELFTLLAMGTPIGWLERVPTYKDQQEKLKDKDLTHLRLFGLPIATSGRYPDLPRQACARRRRPSQPRGTHTGGCAALQPPLRP